MNRSQFIEHVNRLREPLRRFLVALCCGDSFLADDIAQETFMKAWAESPSLRSDDAFKAWIFRIAYNSFINFRRALKPLDQIPDNQTFIDNDDDNSPDAAFRYQHLYNALQKLSPSERSSILLFYMQGYSVKEIADIENVSIDAVKKHLSRGREHLRQIISI